VTARPTPRPAPLSLPRGPFPPHALGRVHPAGHPAHRPLFARSARSQCAPPLTRGPRLPASSPPRSALATDPAIPAETLAGLPNSGADAEIPALAPLNRPADPRIPSIPRAAVNPSSRLHQLRPTPLLCAAVFPSLRRTGARPSCASAPPRRRELPKAHCTPLQPLQRPSPRAPPRLRRRSSPASTLHGRSGHYEPLVSLSTFSRTFCARFGML